MLLIVFLLAASNWSSSVQAADPLRLLTFDEAVRIALNENSDIRGIRYQEEAFSYRASQALAPNNPFFTLSKNDLPGVSFTKGASTIYSLSYTLGFPGKALSQSASLRHQGEASREQALGKEIDIITALSTTYVSLGANEQLRKILEDETRKSKDLLSIVQRKYASAQVAQVDLLNAQVVLAKSEHDLLVCVNNQRLLITQFLSLVNRPGAKDIAPKIPDDTSIPKLDRSLDELAEIMHRNRPALLALGKQVESAQSLSTGANLSALPDIQFTGAMNVYHVATAEPVPGNDRDYSLGIGVAIPLFFPFNELNTAKAARRDQLIAEAQVDSSRISALADLETLYTKFESVTAEADILQNLVIPGSKASYDLTLKTYTLGRVDYLRLNDSRQNWIQAEKDLLQKKIDAADSYNKIVQQVGCDFPMERGFHVCK